MASTGTETCQTFLGRTDLKLKKLQYLWTISNFSFCTQVTGKNRFSPIFGPIGGPRWKFSLYPNGEDEDRKNYISLFLILHSGDPERERETFVKFKFTLLNSKLVSILNRESASTPWCLDAFKKGLGYGQLITKDKLMGLIKDDELNICCELTIFDGYEINSSEQSDNANTSPVPDCTLSSDLGSTFKEQKFGDTIIEVADKEFLVYRGILQSRSPIFAAMFQHELEEKKQNRVVITDAKPNVIEEMLTYIYTGRSPNIETMANDLLPVAEKYNLERLKTMTENVMSGNLTRENAVEILISADLYGANQLRKNVIHFIITESYHFLQDAVWENLQSSLSKTPDLMTELMKALCMSKK